MIFEAVKQCSFFVLSTPVAFFDECIKPKMVAINLFREEWFKNPKR